MYQLFNDMSEEIAEKGLSQEMCNFFLYTTLIEELRDFDLLSESLESPTVRDGD